jgi:CubicO group peptidase (beta-lactamase class C family)
LFCYICLQTLPMTIKTCILIILFSFLFIGCTKNDKFDGVYHETSENGLPTIIPSAVKYEKLNANFIASKRASIQQFCDKYWKDENRNFSFLVAKNGQIIYEKYQGIGDHQKQTKITSETPLHIASVSKVLTATAVLLLIDRNKITLDQKVNTILDHFPYPEVTVKNLLSHRSGLRNYAYFTEDKGVWDRKNTLTNQDILTLFTEKKIALEYPTDTHFSYCNTNYAMLALIIEKITGLNYRDAMQEMLFKPLGMKNSYVFDYKKDLESAIPSYKGNNVQLAWDYLDDIYGDKNIYSTPRDLLRFDLARNAPTFLNPKLRSQIYKGYSNEHKGIKNYGLGIRIVEWETGQKFYFHNGWWHGNTSSYISLGKDHTTIIALSNKFTKNVYAVRKMAPLFGDYPFEFADED